MLLSSHSWDGNSNLKRYMHTSVHGSTIYKSQDMEESYMSLDEDKEGMGVCVYIYIHITHTHTHTHTHTLEYYSATKKKEILQFATM